MTPLTHNYSHLAGKTVGWDTSDSEESYLKNMQEADLRQRLAGFINNPIEYQYNSHGFRTEEFNQQFDVACFGCSFTMGTGVHSRDTWPSQLAALTGLKIANLGHAGSSNDTAFRFAYHYLKFLKPRYAVWLQTDMHRIEVLDESIPLSLNIMARDTSNICASDYFIKMWFSSFSNQWLNLQKNTLAFEQLCSSLNIKSVILKREDISTKSFPDNTARDLRHPGGDVYKILAQKVKVKLSGPDIA